jgi:SM-20-related protein
MISGNNVTVEPPHGPDIYERIALRLAEAGWCVTPDFLAPQPVEQLREEAGRIWDSGGFRHAGVGRGAGLQLRPEVRTDRVCWIDPQAASLAQRLYLQALEHLRQAINRTLFIGLFDFEGHLAIYPPGSYYRKHLDQFRDIGARTVTCVLYLNRDWTDADGGQLRIYTDPQAPSHHEDILPLGGQLVTFLSARFLHEVLPSRRHRASLTGWFRRRAGHAGVPLPEPAPGNEP